MDETVEIEGFFNQRNPLQKVIAKKHLGVRFYRNSLQLTLKFDRLVEFEVTCYASQDFHIYVVICSHHERNEFSWVILKVILSYITM